MKSAMRSMLLAGALLTASAHGTAAPEVVTAGNGATSVSEMMQRKHARQLRAGLVADGLWNEVRQLDEHNAANALEQRENRIAAANAALSRGYSAGANGPDPSLNQCDPGKSRKK